MGAIRTAPLDDLATVQMGYHFRDRLERYPTGEIAVIQMRDVDSAGVLRLEGCRRVSVPEGKSHHFVRSGDLLFRARGLSYGAVQVHEGIGTAVLAAPLLRIRPYKAWPAYLRWFLNAPETQARLAGLAEGTSVQMIRIELLKALAIPLPSEAEQHRIAEAADLAEREALLMTEIAGRRRRIAAHSLMRCAEGLSRRVS